MMKTPEQSDIQRAVDLGLIISGTEKAPVIVPLVLRVIIRDTHIQKILRLLNSFSSCCCW